MIATSGAPLHVAIPWYHSCALTVLSYVSMFHMIPASMTHQERGLMGRLLHFPANTMAATELFSMDEWGSYRLICLLPYSMAIMMRTALVTTQIWQEEVRMLRQEVYEITQNVFLKSLPNIFNNSLSPVFWDTPPIAVNLANAARGFPDSPALAIPGAAALRAFATARAEDPRFPKRVQTALLRTLIPALYPNTLPN